MEKLTFSQVLSEATNGANTSKEVVEDLKVEAERAEALAKVNMLDAKLSMENIDKLIESGDLTKKNVDNANALKNVAKQQLEFNYHILSDGLNDAEKLDALAENSVFRAVSKSLSRWYDSKLAEKHGVRRGYRVVPSSTIGHHKEHVDPILTKMETKVRGMDFSEQDKCLKKIVGEKHARPFGVMLFEHQNWKEWEGGLAPMYPNPKYQPIEFNAESYAKACEVVLIMAEDNYAKYNKEHTKKSHIKPVHEVDEK